jgi:hypothetical protein
MHSRLFSNDPRVSGMAYGFWEAEQNNQSMIMHGGDTLLFHSQLVLLPERSLGLFVSCNSPSGESGEQAGRDLLQAFMDRYYPVPLAGADAPNATAESGEDLGRFTGSFRPARSAFTTFEKAGTLFSQVKVSRSQNGTLTIARPGQDEKQWTWVEPAVFQPADVLDAGAAGEKAVFRDSQGKADYLFFEDNPTTAYERVAWYEEAGFSFEILASCILFFLSTLIWPLRSFCASFPAKQEGPVSGPARAARWLAGASGMLSLLFLLGLTSTASSSPTNEIIYSMLASLQVLLTIPLITAVLMLACAAFCAFAWKSRWWSLKGRIHYTGMVLSLLAFIWWLNNWNLLGYRL